jgi:hypothetical protein
MNQQVSPAMIAVALVVIVVVLLVAYKLTIGKPKAAMETTNGVPMGNAATPGMPGGAAGGMQPMQNQAAPSTTQ